MCSVQPNASASALRSMADSANGRLIALMQRGHRVELDLRIVDRLAHGRARQRQARIRRNGQRQAPRGCKDQPVETV